MQIIYLKLQPYYFLHKPWTLEVIGPWILKYYHCSFIIIDDVITSRRFIEKVKNFCNMFYMLFKNENCNKLNRRFTFLKKEVERKQLAQSGFWKCCNRNRRNKMGICPGSYEMWLKVWRQTRDDKSPKVLTKNFVQWGILNSNFQVDDDSRNMWVMTRNCKSVHFVMDPVK